METYYFAHPTELRRNLALLEQKLGVKIMMKGKQISFEGDSLQEFEARIVLDAIKFGFSAQSSLKLLDEGMIFRKIPIKSFTRRKDLEDVRGRVIGKEGKTKRTIEHISGCEMVVNENEVGLIGSAEGIDDATTAVTNLIRGSKQSNVYHLLEQSNARRKEIRGDLGLKPANENKNESFEED